MFCLGHAAIVGPTMSGKESLIRLSSFIMQFSVLFLSSSSKDGNRALHNDIQQVLLRAALKDEKLVVICNIESLDSGELFTEIQDLLLVNAESSSFLDHFFGPDGAENVYATLQLELESRELASSRRACFALFVSRLIENLRICFLFSAYDAFHLSTGHFPFILKETTVLFFPDWDPLALDAISYQYMNHFSLVDFDKKQFASKFLSHAFVSAKKIPESTYKGMHICFKKFLVSLSVYEGIVRTESGYLCNEILRFETGLGKLRSILHNILILEQNLDQKAAEIEEKKMSADQLVDSISRDQSCVLEEVENLQAEASKCDELEFRCAMQQQDCTQVLTEAEPSIFAAEMALNTIDKKDIVELKSLFNPPAGVDDVTGAILALKGEAHKSRDWNAAKYMMRDPASFILELKGFKEAIDNGKLSASNVESARQYIDLPHFKSSVMLQRSKAVAGLCDFVINIISYYDIIVSIEPKRKAVELAKVELMAATVKKTTLSEKIQELRSRIAELETEYMNVLDSKNAAIRDAEKLQKQVTLAQRFVAALTLEQNSWAEKMGHLKARDQKLVLGSLAPAAFVSYAGTFSPQARKTYLQDFLIPFLTKNLHPSSFSVACSPTDFFSESLGKCANTSWLQDGTMVENELIVRFTKQTPIFVDPHLVGFRWIQAYEKGKNLKIELLSSPALKSSLSNAVQFGWSLLIEGVDDDIEDKELWSLVLKRKFKKGLNAIYYVAEKECEQDPSFQLFLHSGHSSPHYCSKMLGECTVINFALSEEGLENHFLDFILRNELPDAIGSRTAALQRFDDLSSQQKNIDDAVLQKLSESSENMIHNLHEIQFFENSRRSYADILSTIEEVGNFIKNVEDSVHVYRRAARRVSIMFLLLGKMHKINQYYRFSMDSFLDILFGSIFSKQCRYARSDFHVSELLRANQKNPFQRFKLASMVLKAGLKGMVCLGARKLHLSLGNNFKQGHDDPESGTESRIQEIISITMKQLHDFCCTGLQQKHQLVFTSMLLFLILSSEQLISSVELDYLTRSSNTRSTPQTVVPSSLLTFLSENTWASICSLQNVQALVTLPSELESNADRWNIWYNSMHAETMDMPGKFKSVSRCQKLLILRALRPDRVIPFLKDWISEEFGSWFLVYQSHKTKDLLKKCGPSKPAIFLTNANTDIGCQLDQLIATANEAPMQGISDFCFGLGQDVQIVQAVHKAMQCSSWLLLRNVHMLHPKFSSVLNYLVNDSAPKHPGFRCFLTVDASYALPETFSMYFVEKSLKISPDSPVGLKYALRRECEDIKELNSGICSTLSSKLLYTLCLFNAYCQVRHQSFLVTTTDSNHQVPSLFSMRSLLLNIEPTVSLLSFLEESTYSLSAFQRVYEYVYCNNGMTVWGKWKYAELLCQLLVSVVDSKFKEAFFPITVLKSILKRSSSASHFKLLHDIESLCSDEALPFLAIPANIEAQALRAKADNLFSSITKINSFTPDVYNKYQVREVLSDLMNQLPGNMSMLEMKDKMLGSAPQWNQHQAPLAHVLIYECCRINDFLSMLRSSMQTLREVLDGTVLAKKSDVDMFHAIRDSTVPGEWARYDIPSLKSLGPWFFELLERVSKLLYVCDYGPIAASIWIAGLFSPALIFTAALQVESRHTGVPVELCSIQCVVTGHEWVSDKGRNEHRDNKAESGYFIYGMFIDGARWDVVEGCLTDQRPKEYLPKLPLVHIKAALKSNNTFSMDEGVQTDLNIYDCPTFRNFAKESVIFSLPLEAGSNLKKMVLNDVSLLLSI